MLDVEGGARTQMQNALGQLRRTGLGVRTTPVDVALLGVDQLGAAARACRRHDELTQLLLAADAVGDDRPHQLGNDVARFAHHDGVAHENAFALDLVRVVQRGAGHSGPGHVHRVEHGDRRDTARAADLNDDVAQTGVDLLGRILVGDAPARGAGRVAQARLQGQVVDLDDDAVERMLYVVAVFAVVLDHVGDFSEAPDDAVVRRDGDAPLPVEAIGLRLRRQLRSTVGERRRSPLDEPEAMGVEAEAALGRDARILLTQRAGGRVARVGERGLAFGLAARVEGGEVVEAHEHFAAHFHQMRDAIAGQLRGDGRDRADIEGDVLADDAVAARQALNEHAIAVNEVERQAVDLDLAGHGQRLPVGDAQFAAHAVVPAMQFLETEHVIEAEHARGVAHGGEVVGEGAAHPVRGRIQGIQGREPLLQGLQGAQTRVVGGVGGHGRVTDVVGDLVALRPGGERRVKPFSPGGVQRGEVEVLQDRNVLVGAVDRGDRLKGDGIGSGFGGRDVSGRHSDAPGR